MMHILVIFTGGTIGSRLQQGWISPDENTAYQLIDSFYETEGRGSFRFSTCSPYTTLSENLTANHLNQLIARLELAQTEEYDGIIIAHGTDTLAYSAAAAAYTIQPTCPILFVSAAYPLEDRRSNGLDNFRAAVHFIDNRPKKGVYVSYRNANEQETTIHLATNLTEYVEGSADLYSTNTPYATVDNEKKQVTFLSSQASSIPTVISGRFCENPRILLIASAPEQGYDYDADKYNAVIFYPYHSHTLNTDNPRLKDFCVRAKGRNLPLFVAGKPTGETYESNKEYDQLGLIPVACTRASLYIKCWLAISLQKDVKEFVLSF